MSRRRILYVENGLGLGGATRCLQHLVASAEKRGYEPFVAIAYHDSVIENVLNAEHRIDLSPYRRWGTSAQPEPQLNELSRLGRRVSAAARSTFNRLARDGPLTRLLETQIDRLQIDLVHTNNGLLCARGAR